MPNSSTIPADAKAVSGEFSPTEAIATAALFQVGGTLRRDAIYVQRRADVELPAALLRREFCYVLAPRQIGKSSLRVRTAEILQTSGMQCVSIDLTTIGGKHTTAAEWYFGLIDEMARQLGLPDPVPFWTSHELLSPVQRWVRYLHDEVLTTPGPVVIFIDEIDAVLVQVAVSSDEFFAAIRAIYNSRADDSIYERVSFCLFGVATPADLIQEENRTPFNIGRGVLLADFTRAELVVLEPLLKTICKDPAALVDELFAWTAGHPYMTQKFGHYLAERATPIVDPLRDISAAAEHLFLRPGHMLESTLAHAQQCFARDSRLPRLSQMLRLYHRLLLGTTIPSLSNDPVQLGLRMTGLAAERIGLAGPILAVRNRIFASIFDLGWVAARDREQRFSELFLSWLESGRRSEYLLRGEALRKALAHIDGREDVTSEEHAFLIAGLELENEAKVELERRARLESERRLNRRFIQVLSALLVGLALALATALNQYFTVRATNEKIAAFRKNERLMHASLLGRQRMPALPALIASMETAAPILLAGETLLPEEADVLLSSAAFMASVPSTQLRSGAGPVKAAVFSPDGRWIVTSGATGVAEVWDAQTAQRVRSFRAAEGGGFAVTYSHDGKKIATGESRGVISVWDAAAGQTILQVRGHANRITRIEYSPDDRLLATSSGDETVRIWEASTGKELQILQGHEGGYASVQFSPDGSRAITASDDGTARIWEVSTGKELKKFHELGNRVRCAAFSPVGAHIVTGVDDATEAHVWQLDSAQPNLALKGHVSSVESVAFSPDGRRIVTGGTDNTARVFDTASGHPLLTLEGHSNAINSVAFSPDGHMVLTASDDETVRLWHVDTVQQLPVMYNQTGYPFGAAAYSPAGDLIVTTSTDGSIAIWQSRTGQLVRSWPGHAKKALYAEFSPDGNEIVSCSSDGTAVIWDAHSGRTKRILIGHAAPIIIARFSPQGDRVVTSGVDATTRVWDASTGKEILTLRGDNEGFYDASWSPSGQQVVAGSDNGTARVWDAGTGKQLLSLRGNLAPVYASIYSPRGDQIATGSKDGRILIFDAHNGALLNTFIEHTGEIYTLHYSQDGERLVSASLDRQVRVLDAHTGHALRVVTFRDKAAKGAMFSPDGDWLVTTDSDITTRVIPLNVHTLYASACALLKEQLDLLPGPHAGAGLPPNLDAILAACRRYANTPVATVSVSISPVSK